MANRLQKSYTDIQKFNFVVDNQGKVFADGSDTYITEDDLTFKAEFLFALEPNEMMSDVEVEIDVPDVVEEGQEQTYHKENVTVYRPVINPNYEEEQAAIRESNFDKAFFNTSLGYIRRAVTMQDGSKKDFLSDLLPIISMSVNAGQTVNVLAYDRPPFDHDITDWTQYQHSVEVTAEFIQECFLQLSTDFFPPAPKKRSSKK